MREIDADLPCPCGTGKKYRACCAPFLSGHREARTAEQLMRSRFTANVLGNGEYLVRTWHPDTRPPGAITDFAGWYRLEILATAKGQAGDALGEVEFRAWYRQDGAVGLLHERSRFVRVEGKWRYLDGRIMPAPQPQPGRVGRNSPCPCGSGKKYKRCCLRR